MARKKTTETEAEMLPLPLQLNIVQYIRFWSGNAIAESKGGSFNTDLYIRYLTIKSKL
jgi:hypothetical protein